MALFSIEMGDQGLGTTREIYIHLLYRVVRKLQYESLQSTFILKNWSELQLVYIKTTLFLQ